VPNIIIFEDNDRLRESLVYLLNSDKRYKVVYDSDNCDNAASLVTIYQPEVVMMDIDMPGISGIEGVKRVKEARPQTVIIMYTVFEDDEKLFACLCAGANGYLLKKTPPARLFDAIEEAWEGGAPMNPSIASKVLASFRKKTNHQKYNLSVRELEVLQLLIQGHSTKIMASTLFISFETVRSHLKNIYNKLHVNCGKEAIAKVLNERII
jgi:DNA-binding NarL/FixJ family response regulator